MPRFTEPFTFLTTESGGFSGATPEYVFRSSYAAAKSMGSSTTISGIPAGGFGYRAYIPGTAAPAAFPALNGVDVFTYLAGSPPTIYAGGRFGVTADDIRDRYRYGADDVMTSFVFAAAGGEWLGGAAAPADVLAAADDLTVIVRAHGGQVIVALYPRSVLRVDASGVANASGDFYHASGSRSNWYARVTGQTPRIARGFLGVSYVDSDRHGTRQRGLNWGSATLTAENLPFLTTELTVPAVAAAELPDVPLLVKLWGSPVDGLSLGQRDQITDRVALYTASRVVRFRTSPDGTFPAAPGAELNDRRGEQWRVDAVDAVGRGRFVDVALVRENQVVSSA